jgi:hypothetical protein
VITRLEIFNGAFIKIVDSIFSIIFLLDLLVLQLLVLEFLVELNTLLTSWDILLLSLFRVLYHRLIPLVLIVKGFLSIRKNMFCLAFIKKLRCLLISLAFLTLFLLVHVIENILMHLFG